MQHPRLRLASCWLALSAFATSCVSAGFVRVVDLSNLGVELAKTAEPNGGSTSWRLYPGSNDEPRIDRTSTRVELVPHLGIAVSPVTSRVAESRGLTRWRGVHVDRVDVGSPAARMKLVRGDVILRVAGEEVSSPEQFTELLMTHGKPGEPLELTLFQRRRGGDPIEDGAARVEEAPITIVPVSDTVRSTATDSFELSASKGIQHYTGLQVATVPEELATSIYGERRAVPVLTGVVTGSPAYHAGLRTGDRILNCDGRSVESITDLRGAVLDRITAIDAKLPAFDLLDGTASRPLPATDSNQPLRIEVTGPLGQHTADVPVRDDLGEDVQFHIPIITNYESTIDRTQWSLLDFIFQFGFNYKSWSYPSTSRAPVESSHFSLFPFGMFEFTHDPESSSYRLFWFIRFSTER